MLRHALRARALPEGWPHRTIVVIRWVATFIRSLALATLVGLLGGLGELSGLATGWVSLVAGLYGVVGFFLVVVAFLIHDLVEITRPPPRIFSRGLPFLRALARAVVG